MAKAHIVQVSYFTGSGSQTLVMVPSSEQLFVFYETTSGLTFHSDSVRPMLSPLTAHHHTWRPPWCSVRWLFYLVLWLKPNQCVWPFSVRWPLSRSLFVLFLFFLIETEGKERGRGRVKRDHSTSFFHCAVGDQAWAQVVHMIIQYTVQVSSLASSQV